MCYNVIGELIQLNNEELRQARKQYSTLKNEKKDLIEKKKN